MDCTSLECFFSGQMSQIFHFSSLFSIMLVIVDGIKSANLLHKWIELQLFAFILIPIFIHLTSINSFKYALCVKSTENRIVNFAIFRWSFTSGKVFSYANREIMCFWMDTILGVYSIRLGVWAPQREKERIGQMPRIAWNCMGFECLIRKLWKYFPV